MTVTEYKIRKATQEEITHYKNFQTLKIDSYTPKLENKEVSFGCQSFNVMELCAIRRLFSKEINADISIKGKKITHQYIQKLIELVELTHNT